MRKLALARAAFLLGPAALAVTLFWPGEASAQDALPAPAAKAAKTNAKKPATPVDAAAAAAAATAAKDPVVATRNYNSGVAAYQAGKFDAAVQSINTAIQSGGLPGNLLAKALYYRGASFHGQGKSGQAISDLTSALWLKGGLDDAERAEASRLRSAAYASAGVSDQGQTTAQSSGTTTGKAPPATSSPITTGSVSQVAGPQRNAVPGESAAASPSEGGLGNLFGNLFGGSSSKAPAAAPVAAAPDKAVPAPIPALIPPAAATSKTAPAGTGATEVLPWVSKETQPAAAAAPLAAKAPVAKKTAAAGATPGGKIVIQVAALKTRDEASEVLAKLKAAGGMLAEAPASVDEATFGTMGTFYRVRLGPYANAAAAKAPCDALKASGLDCPVTAK